MAQIMEGVIAPDSEKPHVFLEVTYNVTTRNPCGLSSFYIAKVFFRLSPHQILGVLP